MHPVPKTIFRALPLLLALPACDVALPGEPGDDTAAATSSGTTTTSDPATTSDPPTTSDTTTSADPDATSDGTTAAGDGVPPQLAGRSWTWATSAGVHTLTFAADGEYTSAVLVNGHPGESCGIEYFTYRVGVAVFAGTTLTLSPNMSERTKFDSCSNQDISKEIIDDVPSIHEWRLTGDGGCPEALVLTDGDGVETSYCADA